MDMEGSGCENPPKRNMESMESRDFLLSELITRTSANPGLAQDLLEAHSWELKSALRAFYVMKGMLPQHDEDSISKSLPSPRIIEIKNTTTTEKNSVKFSSEPLLSSSSPVRIPNECSVPAQKSVSKCEVNEETVKDLPPKKLLRGISRATDNVNLVSKARTEFAEDFKTWNLERRRKKKSKDTMADAPDYTFTLPDLSIHMNDFRTFLEKDLIEKSTLISLESSGRLNWWADLGASQKLWPLATTGDGNCLLHAASLGMWGFHDRLLTLRRALHDILISSVFKESFYRRWRWQTSIQNKESGLILCEEEWEKEWQCLLKMASTEPRVRANLPENKNTELNGGKKTNLLPEDEMPPHVYESLEEMHIFALAHVLRRPIIVISDTMLKDVKGDPFAPIPFGGIYLPLQCTSTECHRSPLCLTYDSAHFSALVSMDKETYADKTPHPPAVIPLTDPDRRILVLQFSVDPGPDAKWVKSGYEQELIIKLTLTDKDKLGLLREYLDVRHTPVPNNKAALAVEEPTVKPVKLRNSYLEKSQTLPSNFEFDDNKSETGTQNSGTTSGGKGSSTTGQSKAAKQIHNITKHFGSLGRSMSKRIKKNLGSLARRGSSFRSNNSSPKQKRANEQKSLTLQSSGPDRIKKSESNSDFFDNAIISAVLHTHKRHEYHDEMIRNYLNTARVRFEQQKEQPKNNTSTTSAASSTSGNNSSSDSTSNSTITTTTNSSPDHFATQCVSEKCINYGTAATNYLCHSCFIDQKKEMSKCIDSTNGKLEKDDRENQDSVNGKEDPVKVDSDSDEKLVIEKSIVKVSLIESSTCIPKNMTDLSNSVSKMSDLRSPLCVNSSSDI